jgi:hypothetical protein
MMPTLGQSLCKRIMKCVKAKLSYSQTQNE